MSNLILVLFILLVFVYFTFHVYKHNCLKMIFVSYIRTRETAVYLTILVMSMMVSFCAVLFPRDVLDEILNLIESVPEGFPTYS